MVERYRNVVFTPATQANLKDQPRAQSKGMGLGVSKAHGDFNALPAVPDELHSIFRDTAASTTTTSASATATATPAVAPATQGGLSGRGLVDEEVTDRRFRQALRPGYPVRHV